MIIILLLSTRDLSMFFLPPSLLWLACSLKSFSVRWKLSEKCTHESLKISLLRPVMGNKYCCIHVFLLFVRAKEAYRRQEGSQEEHKKKRNKATSTTSKEFKNRGFGLKRINCFPFTLRLLRSLKTQCRTFILALC